MLCYGVFVVCDGEQLGMGGVGVGQCFLCCESFVGDDEQGCLWIEMGKEWSDVGVIDVGDEMDIDVWLLLGGQCLGCYVWVEIGVVDVDIDDIGDVFIGEVLLVVIVDVFVKFLYVFEYGLYFGWCLSVGMQCYVVDSVVFGVINCFVGQYFLFLVVDVGSLSDVM